MHTLAQRHSLSKALFRFLTGMQCLQVNLPNSNGLGSVRQASAGDDLGSSLICIVNDRNPSLGSFFQGANTCLSLSSGQNAACPLLVKQPPSTLRLWGGVLDIWLTDVGMPHERLIAVESRSCINADVTCTGVALLSWKVPTCTGLTL